MAILGNLRHDSIGRLRALIVAVDLHTTAIIPTGGVVAGMSTLGVASVIGLFLPHKLRNIRACILSLFQFSCPNFAMSTSSQPTLKQLEDVIALMGKTASGPEPEDPYIAQAWTMANVHAACCAR